MNARDKLIERLHAIFYHTRKWVWFSSLALSIVLVIAIGIAKYWMPSLLADKARVERYLSSLSKQSITIGRIQSSWDGIYPGIRATDIQIHDPLSTATGIRLKEARFSLSYVSAFKGQPILHRVVLVEPDLGLVRDRSGKVRVTGIRTQKPQTAGQGDESGGTVAANWLLAQGLIEIRRGKLVWNDQLDRRSGPLELNDVNLSLRNDGERHQLTLDARFPRDICGVCSFKADIEGNPFVSGDWGGFIDINAIGLTLRNRLTLIARKFPEGLDGKVDLVLRSQWAEGRPRLAFGRVAASEIDVPLGKFGKSLTVNELVANLKWRGRRNTWSVDMNVPFVRVNQETWLPGQVQVSRYDGGTAVYVRHLDISKAVRVAGRFNVPEKPRTLLAKLKPAGDIDDLYVDLKDTAEGEQDNRVNVRATLRGIETTPYQKIPGVKGLNATFETTENSGEIFLNSYQSEFYSTHVFREPIRMHRAKARITWQKKNNIIEVNTQNIQMNGHDLNARGGFVFQFPLDRSQSPHLDLRAELFNGVVARKSTYLPVNVMKPSLVKWLDDSVVSGKMTNGHVIYRGKTREFPFVNNNGLFEVLVNVDHGKLKYLPGWKPISSANMTLLFRGQGMVITGSAGKVDQLDINEIVARKENLKNPQEPVRISGRLTGSAGNTLAVLRNAVANGQRGGWTKFVESDVRASGLGQLTLGIELPTRSGRKHRLQGRYEFLGSDMVLPVGDIPTNDMFGSIRFNEKRLVDGVIRGRALGGPVIAHATGGTSRREPDTLFKLSGRMTTAGLAREYGEWVDKYFSGSVPWSGELAFKNGIARVSMSGNAKGVTNNLPEPVGRLSGSVERFRLYTTSSTEKRHILRFSLGRQVDALLDYQAQGSGWRFAEGHLLVGDGLAKLSGDNQLFMEFRGPRIDGNAWTNVVYGAGRGDGIPMLVQAVGGSFDEVNWLDKKWGKTAFRLDRKGLEKWSGTLTGKAIDGTIHIDTEPDGGAIAMNLQRLHIPWEQKKEKDKEKPGPGKKKKELDPRSFPTLVIDSKEFAIGPMALGQLNFSAERTRIGWEIDRLQLTRPDMSVFADGTWFSVAGKHVTRGKLRFTSSDLGATLTALGSPGQVTGGKLNLDVNLNWREDRNKKDLANLNGEISMHARDGMFNKLKPDGGGGPLSLFALSRYLSLDFSPALGKGFAFNDIKGKVTIQHGDARTDGFTLTAPAAAAVARGHIDLGKREIDVNADIYPNLRGGVTVATGSLFGLQAAAWVYALQQLFSSEIEKGTRISYRITGKLDKPKVTKVVSSLKKGDEE